ncbi:MAG TPA: DUF1565 domain-containing protein [Tepidisphaeraceae bacterium]|nr:DUF1565 domain-containing protein [Tepidisphaeraceae bacterium]
MIAETTQQIYAGVDALSSTATALEAAKATLQAEIEALKARLLPTAEFGTASPPAAAVKDGNGTVWTLVNGQIARDGVVDPVTNEVDAIIDLAGTIYQTAHGMWWRQEAGKWVKVSTSTPPPPKPAPAPVYDFYVSILGSDNDAGTHDKPLQTIQKAVDLSKDGQSIFVYRGWYYEAVTITKTIKLVGESEAGVVLDGHEKLPFGLDLSKSRNAEVSNLTVTKYFSGYHPDESAIRAGSGCILKDITSEFNVGGGCAIGNEINDTKFYRVKANDNGLDGFQAARCEDNYFEDCENHRNNYGHVLNAARAAKGGSYKDYGGGKFGKSKGYEVNKFARTLRRRMVRHKASGNNGLDMWDDIGNEGVHLVDCDIDYYAYELAKGGLTIEGGSGHIGIWESGKWSVDGGKTWNFTRWSVKGHKFNKLAQDIDPKGFAMELRQMSWEGKPKERSYDDHRTGEKVHTMFGGGDIIGCTILDGPFHTDGSIFGHPVKPSDLGIVSDGNQFSPDSRGLCWFFGGYATGRWNLKKCQEMGIEKNSKLISKSAA